MASTVLRLPAGIYHVALLAVGENDGRSTFEVKVGDQSLGKHTAPLSTDTFEDRHNQVATWTRKSAEAGKPWVVSFDEPGDASFGMPPDDGYANMAQLRKSGKINKAPTVDEVRLGPRMEEIVSEIEPQVGRES